MSLEPGGRASKYGNEYENRFFAKLLIRLVQEELNYIIVEPIGKNSDSVEFVAENKAGRLEHFQCKASNCTSSSWSIPDLQRYSILSRAKEIITNDNNSDYFFISPLPYKELDEICKRARTTSSTSDFISYQLSNEIIRNTFVQCAIALKLDPKSTSDQDSLISFLSHCYFELYPNNEQSLHDIDCLISCIFTGKPYNVRVLLEQFANASGRYGVKISINDVVEYLQKNDVYLRNMNYDDRILPRIKTINKNYWYQSQGINGKIIFREATTKIIQTIESGASVVLHGKAGSGKSACLQETINYFEKNNILYLAVKLDVFIPEISADNYGKQLGLPTSPVQCLLSIAGDKPCVLILDQLDALRWSTRHSAISVSVCKELMDQATAYNKHEGKRISIIFASRTFDLDNDRGLIDLFEHQDENTVLSWQKIKIENFTKNEVIQLIGEEYNELSPRLQQLLLTPSSLYIWSQLKDTNKTNTISSTHQLMTAWWQQILESAKAQLNLKDSVRHFVNRIVQQMTANMTFNLPKTLFLDDADVISYLVSNGLMKDDNCTISFVHQSFLDFFITVDSINKIYEGTSIVDLIDSFDNQLPQLRYRLLFVLQNLIEADQEMFIKQASFLLESDRIRFYFQCAVFETVGQCNNPSDALFRFIDQFAMQQKWTNYIINTVYCKHPIFVRHLDSDEYNWLEDMNLSILKTIRNSDPDFVAETLSRYQIINHEQAYTIYNALCLRIVDDSDKMFHFRLELINLYPDLLDSFLGFSGLLDSNPSRTICLLKTLIKVSSRQRFEKIYISSEKEIKTFAIKNCEKIVNELLFVIIQESGTVLVEWPFHSYMLNEKDEDWIENSFHDSVLRIIVKLTKIAIAEYAKINPDRIAEIVEKHNAPLSAIGHELFSHAINCLPSSYSDIAINWLLRDFSSNIFVFTDSQEDYLCYSKQIIRKYVSSCSIPLFQELEHQIIGWKESTDTMCRVLRYRIEANKNNSSFPNYTAFWGHMQKELLPCLDTERTSLESKNLLSVLNRNTWVTVPHFYSSLRIGPAKSVVSPVYQYTERISDKCWLNIINTPNEKMTGHGYSSDEGPNYIEANHMSFADSLRKQAKLEPERFAGLSLQFPPNCFSGYITGVINAIESAERNIDIELVNQVINRFIRIEDRNVCIAISRLIEKKAAEEWSDIILTWLAKVATTHTDPKTDEFTVTSNRDPNHHSVQTLQDNSFNCTRGCALYAITALIWEHQDMVQRFKKTISSSCKDNHPAVLFAALYSLLPIYNVDREFAINQFKQLLDSDLRIIGAHGFWSLLYNDYENDRDYYRGKIIEACKTDIEDLSQTAAGILCAIAIFFDDELLHKQIVTCDFSFEQIIEICKQAVSSFNTEIFHKRSKDILLHYIKTENKEITCLHQLFFHNSISVDRDTDFLISLMKSKQSPFLMDSFIDYINKSDNDLCGFVDIIATAAESIKNLPNSETITINIKDLLQCVIRLLDRGRIDPRIKKTSLDICDSLFKSNIYISKQFTDMIEAMNDSTD